MSGSVPESTARCWTGDAAGSVQIRHEKRLNQRFPIPTSGACVPDVGIEFECKHTASHANQVKRLCRNG